ncbi:MAG: TolB family protein [Parapedobacter sp.]
MRMSLILFIAFAFFMSCTKDDNRGNTGQDPSMKGTLVYPSADELMVYSFADKIERTVFSAGYGYNVSADGSMFLWFDYNAFESESTIHIHRFDDVESSDSFTAPYAIEKTPDFRPGSESLGVLVKSADEPLLRTDFHLMDRAGKSLAMVPHVKDFAFSPDGDDLIIAAEALDAQGNPAGYAIAKISDFAVEGQAVSNVIRTFADYSTVPVDLAISPDGATIAYTFNNHIYTLLLTKGAEHKQVTDSRFNEWDAGWSPDGKYLVLGFSDQATTNDCSELRIVPADPSSPIQLVPGYDDEPVDDLQPTAGGKAIHGCAVAGIKWF